MDTYEKISTIISLFLLLIAILTFLFGQGVLRKDSTSPAPVGSSENSFKEDSAANDRYMKNSTIISLVSLLMAILTFLFGQGVLRENPTPPELTSNPTHLSEPSAPTASPIPNSPTPEPEDIKVYFDSTPSEPPAPTAIPTPNPPTPGPDDIKGCNEGVEYPNGSWLKDYETKYVKTKRGVRAYLRFHPSKDSGHYDFVYERDMVTVLARQNGYSLVKTADGMAGWVTSSVLVDSY